MVRAMRFMVSSFDHVQKATCVFYNAKAGRLQGYTAVNMEGSGALTEPVEIQPFYDYFFSERRTGSSPKWYSQEDLPFGGHERLQIQADVFNELDKNILLLKSTESKDGFSDLLYLFFEARFVTPGVSAGGNALTAGHKAILGHLFNQSLKGLLNEFRSEKLAFEHYVRNTRNLAQKFQTERIKLEQLQKGIGQSLISLSHEILKELSAGNGIPVKLSPQAEALIRAFSGSINTLKEIIGDGFAFAFSMLEPGQRELVLHDWHLNFEGSRRRETPSDDIAGHQSERLGKTGDLLDRLEFAASSLLKERLPITGKNLGIHCERPISAPAISDALKKHRLRISTLCEQYPDKWPLLRREFAPLKNILSAKKTPSDGRKAV